MMQSEYPKVLFWFKVYLSVLSLMYAVCIALGVCFVFFQEFSARITDEENLVVEGWLLLIAGVVLLAATLLPFFLKPKPWVWVYNLVIICLGMTSSCLVIACIPLLIFWVKPELKKYFGRTDS
jgi:hypothetical protein